MHDQSATLLSFIHLAEKLKRELRHSWLSNGRQESVAEHTWRCCLMALLVHRSLVRPVALERVLLMLVVHDLVEIHAGDVPVFHHTEDKQRKEQEAMRQIVAALPAEEGREIAALWEEFEERTSPEARLAQALDKLEAQIQHNEADPHTWLPQEVTRVEELTGMCDFDPFLKMLLTAVQGEARRKLVEAGIKTGTHSGTE